VSETRAKGPKLAGMPGHPVDDSSGQTTLWLE
jgi:hypothetical protein